MLAGEHPFQTDREGGEEGNESRRWRHLSGKHRVGTTPLHGEQGAHGHFLWRVGGGEKVAVRPMFQFVAERIFPIIENLAAHDVPADPPGRLMLPGFQMLVTEHKVIEVADFKRGMKQTQFTRQLGQE